jgi:hypothetical protein
MDCFRPVYIGSRRKTVFFGPFLYIVDVELSSGFQPAASLIEGAASPGPQPSSGVWHFLVRRRKRALRVKSAPCFSQAPRRRRAATAL